MSKSAMPPCSASTTSAMTTGFAQRDGKARTASRTSAARTARPGM
eukprot:CAMPEP_0179983936 /NCGR_PEP_ID=MMETSP0984-20121128/847_1 /TAXON_ID=483367 /ORGANISM="non described non described, Strain CCMP 2436" /LENGTH=44 /DNA_ID= /DNA_START= /DNA_END= /DNA_ORIENTATION=